MSEYKLGRIRFVWKNDWIINTVYYKDDIIRNGGNTYVCVVGHTSTSDFYVDLPQHWNKISDGQEWKDVWTTNTYYKVNDIVKYGGYLYVANTAHTSAANITLGLEADQAKWDLFIEGLDWKNDWQPNFRYKINDLAKYNGIVYTCIEEHTSAADITLGLEADQAKWQIFSEGLEWLGDWTTAYRYRRNDIVKYGGQLYLCNTGHTSAADITLGLEADQAKWDYYHKGVEYKNTWQSNFRYKINDIVKWGGGLWICTVYHTSQARLVDDESKWDQFVEGLEFDDSWDPSILYQHGDVVTYGGYTYVAVTNNEGLKPSDNTSDWDLFNTGFRFVGDYDGDSTQREYIEGDVIRIGGYSYLCIKKHEGFRPPNTTYWEKLNSGIEWQDAWTDGVHYDLGDSVRYANSSYICVLEHDSDETTALNRPDQANAGNHWNLLVGGTETEVLTTQGDLLIYGSAGQERLPVGRENQVLVSNGIEPRWDYFGKINNIFYVSSEKGSDTKASGLSETSPYATIEYCAYNVLNGILHYDAKFLLEINRSFLQEEVVEWVNYQIANATAGSIWDGFTNSDIAKCRRDIGQILDALMYDLSHGGNVKTRLATLSYFDNNGNLIAAIADEDEQLAASLVFLRDTIPAILQNVPVSTAYSSFTQIIDTDYIIDDESQGIINNLLNIIIDTLTLQTSNNLVAEQIASNTIFVLTGLQQEILPIVIPENTAVVGDELRSTKIHAAGSKTHISNDPITRSVLSRFSAIIELIVTNPGTITKTTGNALNPVTTHPAGTQAVGLQAQDLIDKINLYIDFKINANGVLPTLSGTNTPYTATDYTYSVENIEANREFLKAEAFAYIADQFTTTATATDNVSSNITVGDTSWMVTGMPVKFTGTVFGGIVQDQTYYVKTIVDATTVQIADQLDGGALSVTTATGTMTVTVTVNQTDYSRNIDKVLDAVKYDLIYAGTNKSLAAARFITNDIKGSRLEDMFYLRNGAGLRNCTVDNLNGKTDGDTDQGGDGLSSANAYGTKRPLAGAYASLDPGYGPADVDTHIITRSPYVQNVTTFGEACVGLKVDGDLHSGGNDSIVANDFTQIISDGIGAWITNLGRAELVSVFSYYAHIGYLAENGGKIRATNGNSSYGTYGVVAEGTDPAETAITATVNNQSTEAIIGDVLTDGSGILTLFYENAGVNYTSGGTTIDIFGGGFGESISAVNVVSTGGVFRVRILDTNTTTGQFGGEGYVNSQNVAQSGNQTQIIISNTDSFSSAAYIGMAIWITSGKGVGQYAYIDTYNASNKIATVKKYSDDTAGWDHVIPGTTIETVLDSTTGYSIEPRLMFDLPTAGTYADSAKARAVVSDNKIIKILIWDPGTGYISGSPPNMTITDPNNTYDGEYQVRVGDGVLTQPTWSNRGTDYGTATATVTGDGYADQYQYENYLIVDNLTEIPKEGANIEINNNPGVFYKLVQLRELAGSAPAYSATLQMSPDLAISDAPDHGETIDITIRYSQVRLTGHDFLDVGTGNFTNTNYPNAPLIDPDPTVETNEFGEGRVFYTSTDQDGNFRVGELFSVEQATGTASLNVESFNLAGLNELTLGNLSLGGTGATITEFSTDGTFTANSDSIVPTQRAIKTYINSLIGSGASQLNVNSITAGDINITSNEISNVLNNDVRIVTKINFTKTVSGYPVAMNYFLKS